MKLIQTKDYLLLIDEEAEIKEGWKGIAYKKDVVGEVFKHFYTTNTLYNDAKIVIAYYPLTKEAKELDLPLIPNPSDDKTYWIATVIFKDGTKLKSEKFYEYDSGIKSWSSNFSYLMGDKIEFISYDRYTENQPEQFSLEDMKKAYAQGAYDNYDSCYVDTNNPYGAEVVDINQGEFDKLTEKYFQSLSTQQLPKEFIPEYEYVESVDELWEFQDDDSLPKRKIKTITNSEGKQELVGKWIY